MSTPIWYTACASTFEGQCNLPLIGKLGIISNLVPIHSTNGIPATKTSVCSIGPSGTCAKFYNNLCNEVTCPNPTDKTEPCDACGYYNCPNCQQVGAPYGCVNFVCSQQYECSRKCYPIDLKASCPQAIDSKIHTDTTGTTVICSYVYDGIVPPWPNANLPYTFVNPMVQRYAITLYLAEWTKALYQDPSGQSFFHQLNYLSSTSIDNAIRNNVFNNSNISMYLSYFPANSIEFIQSTSCYPQFIYDRSTAKYQVIIPVYNTMSTSDPNLTAAETSALIQAFLLESTTQLSAPSNTFSKSTLPDVPADILSSKYYIFVDLRNQVVYNNCVTDIANLVSINDITKSNNYAYNIYVIGRIYITTVVRWSPNLIFLFWQTNKTLPFDTIGANGFCDTIVRDTGFVPYQCFLNSCTNSFSDKCKQYTEKYCPQSTLYNTNFSGIRFAAQRFFLQGAQDTCSCYNTRIAPPNTKPPVPAAMCFTRQCTVNQPLMNAFDLSDDICQSYCDKVSNWLTSTDVNNHSVQPASLDVAKFKRLCGDYKPPNRIFNIYVLITGIILAVLVAVGSYVMIKKLYVLFIVLILLLCIAFFLAYDLAGTADCDGTKQVCKTKVTGISIPTTWCVFLFGCECTNYGDYCPDNKSICLQGNCYDISPNSPT